MLLFDCPPEIRSGPIDDSLHLNRRVMNDLHLLSTPSTEVHHLILPGFERVASLGSSREPKEVSRLDFLLSRLGLTLLIEDDTSTFPGSDNVEPLVLVAVPVRDRADVIGRYCAEVDTTLAQAASVTEVQLEFEDVRVQWVRAGFSFAFGIGRAYKIRRTGSQGSIASQPSRQANTPHFRDSS